MRISDWSSDVCSSDLALDDSEELIRWDIGDRGFEMTLSGEVPGRLRETLGRPDVQRELFGDAGPPPLLAVHAGGRSVLDAVEHALAVAPGAPADKIGRASGRERVCQAV